eukprot:129598-Alexandrium_andersonii.AAC.1
MFCNSSSERFLFGVNAGRYAGGGWAPTTRFVLWARTLPQTASPQDARSEHSGPKCGAQLGAAL